MKYAYEKLADTTAIKVFYAPAFSGWIKDLSAVLKGGGTCLVKASRSMNFENILKEI